MAASPTVVAILGFGEAGSAFAADLVSAGAVVHAYDPVVRIPAPIHAAGDEADAVREADLVLSVNSATAAADALQRGIGALPRRAVWADLNTASPALKRRLATTAAEQGRSFADIAIMATVPGRGLRVPMLASGDGAAAASSLLGELGATVEVAEGAAGFAAGRKLHRSVFFKGMAAAVVEAIEAARAAGCEDWLRTNIAAELAGATEATLDRIVSGTYKHAKRRTEEMTAATEMLIDLGIEPTITPATRDLLQRLSATD